MARLGLVFPTNLWRGWDTNPHRQSCKNREKFNPNQSHDAVKEPKTIRLSYPTGSVDPTNLTDPKRAKLNSPQVVWKASGSASAGEPAWPGSRCCRARTRTGARPSSQRRREAVWMKKWSYLAIYIDCPGVEMNLGSFRIFTYFISSTIHCPSWLVVGTRSLCKV